MCSRNPFIEIKLAIKNVKRKKSTFRENFVVISKSCLFAVLKIITNILINLIYG